MIELHIEDALVYLGRVKDEFYDRPHIYKEFIDILKAFKSGRLDVNTVVRRVTKLFEDKGVLMSGFKMFLPESASSRPATVPSSSVVLSAQQIHFLPATGGTDVTPPVELQERREKENRHLTAPVPSLGRRQVPEEFNRAVRYAVSVRERFEGDGPETYLAFLEMLRAYQLERSDVVSVLEEVSGLFLPGHSDLLRGFLFFVPDGAKMQAQELIDAAIASAETREKDPPQIIFPKKRARVDASEPLEPSSSSDECVVCLDNHRSHAFIPCGHRCICETCASKYRDSAGLMKCPICRKRSMSIVKIFM